MSHRSALALCVVAALSICSFAQRNPFTSPVPGLPSDHEIFNSLNGNVISADNKPLRDIHVELRSANGSTINSAYTNSSGAFEFPSVASGTYDIVASSGLSQTQERIDVGNMPESIMLRLPVTLSANDGKGAASVSVAAYKVPDKARNALKKAQEASSKGNTEEAGKLVMKALQAYPKYADALALRAVLKLDTRDMPGAVADLQEAINDDQNCAFAYLVMGSVLNIQLKFDDAIRALDRGQSLSPNSWQGYFEMGKAHLGKGEYEAALRGFNRAQTLLPKDYPLLHLAKAHALFGLKNYPDAVTELQAFLAKDTQNLKRDEAQKLLTKAQALAARAAN